MSVVEWSMTHAPAWLNAVAILALLGAAYMFGRWLRLRRGKNGTDVESTDDGLIASTVLGLLALLLGFTFALAVDRYDARRALVMEEASAILTTHLRARTFAEPHRSRLTRLLEQYGDNRLALGKSQDRQEAAELLAISHALQRRMWQASIDAVAPNRDDVAAAFLDSMSRTIETGAARLAARQSHVPDIVFTVLLVYMVASAATVGYSLGPRHAVAAGVLFALLTMFYLLIYDIDDARRGAVRESQRPMENLKALAAERGASPTL